MIEIGDKVIGEGHPPLIVAEISGNHGGSLENAKSLITLAHNFGADAVKIQSYTPDMLTIDCDKPGFVIDNPVSPWHGRKLFDLYKEAHTPLDWHEELFKHSRDVGVPLFSSPFSEEAVDLLEDLKCPMYKIASFENGYLSLIHKAAKTGKPVVISTGVSDIGIIKEAVNTARKAGCKDLILLKCSSRYPALTADSNVLTIPHMSELFNCPVGLSDHTLGIGAAIAATAHGACMIEKHFKFERDYTSVDSAFSMTPTQFRSLAFESKQAWESLGEVKYQHSEAEALSKAFKRSVYAVQDIKQGEPFTRLNTRIIRPGHGLAPRYYGFIISSYANRDIERGEPLTMDDVGG